MGCHTWCYAELKRSDDFKNKFMKCLETGYREMYEYYYERSDEEWERDLENEKISVKDWLAYYDETEDKSDYIGYFDSEDELKAYVEKCRNIDAKTIDDSKTELRAEFDVAYDAFINMTDFYEYLKKYGSVYAWGFSGKIFQYNEKLYIDTCAHFLGESYDDNDYVFSVEEQFNDIFRIGNYDMPDCHSYDETIAAIEKWVNDEPEANYRGGYDELNTILEHKNDFNIVRHFYDIHPTGIIQFG